MTCQVPAKTCLFKVAFVKYQLKLIQQVSHFFVNIALRMEVAINITSQSSIIHAVLEMQFQSVNSTLVRIWENNEQNKPCW